MKRSPLKKQSSKNKELSVQRRKFRNDFLNESPFCEACVIWVSFDLLMDMASSAVFRHNLAVDVHEVVNRSQGGSILDPLNVMAVCRPCHHRITINPHDASATGMHLPSWCNTTELLNEATQLRKSWVHAMPFIPSWENA